MNLLFLGEESVNGEISFGCSTIGSPTLGLILPRFKLFLEPRVLRDSSTIDSRLPQIPVCEYSFLSK